MLKAMMFALFPPNGGNDVGQSCLSSRKERSAIENMNTSGTFRKKWTQARAYERIIIGLVAVAYLAVLTVGLLSREPMIGDEVQHYFMLVTQAGQLPSPTVDAVVPVYVGKDHVRHYPHVFLWHYVGAVLWKYLGRSFAVVQIYQSLFYLQLMISGWLLMRHETKRVLPMAELLCVVGLASLPLTLIFTVAFYQDVPAVAQLVTSLLLLRRGRLFMSLVFLCVGLWFKESVTVVLPAYLVCVVAFDWGRERPLKLVSRAGIVVAVFVLHSLLAIHVMAKTGCNYYPVKTVRHQLQNAQQAIQRTLAEHGSSVGSRPAASAGVAQPPPIESRKYSVISTSPGDLRLPINWLIYGGGVFWGLAVAGILGIAWGRRRDQGGTGTCGWLAGLAAWCLIAIAFQMKEAPDARFFLPAIILFLFPLCRWAATLPWKRIWIPALCLAAVVQSTVVLGKTYDLRQVRPGVREAIAYLTAHPPQPNEVFMYPEGNARLLPCAHNWYLSYGLRDFWRASNDERLTVLHKRRLGAIVVKKYLVGSLDPAMNNLGIYPDYFVRDIENDKRFAKVLDNRDVAIYLVPSRSD